ncbi:MAG: thioredoxin domain-containing protein [archaeon]
MTDKKDELSKTLKDLSKNYWAISTIILAIVLIIVLVTGQSGPTISAKEVGQKVLDFATSQYPNAGLVSVNDNGQFYEVVLSIEGQEVPVQATKDGQNLIPQLIPLTARASQDTTTPTQTEIPKSDKPVVDLYIWSYCPYGVQAQGPLSQVESILGNYAEFNTILYYDGHGEFETQQNKIQACIQELDKTKYRNYAAQFVETIYPKCSATRDVTCNLDESTKLMDSLGINSAKILECVNTKGALLIQSDSNQAKTNGVTGSPTLIINGVKANVARTAESFKSAICSAFNDAPAECSEVLDSTAATASGNC